MDKCKVHMSNNKGDNKFGNNDAYTSTFDIINDLYERMCMISEQSLDGYVTI